MSENLSGHIGIPPVEPTAEHVADVRHSPTKRVMQMVATSEIREDDLHDWHKLLVRAQVMRVARARRERMIQVTRTLAHNYYVPYDPPRPEPPHYDD